MINTIEALQGLYVALGGELSDVANVTTIPDMLTAISTVAEQGASELPKTTSDDNDMVLTVVNGKWDKAAPASGGNEFFVITTTGNFDLPTQITLDKTFAEINDAYKAGKQLVLFVTGRQGSAGDGYIFLTSCIPDEWFVFSHIFPNTWVNSEVTNLTFHGLKINADDTILGISINNY